MRELSSMGFDYIVCDSPAGIETDALLAMHVADQAIDNPEVSSAWDSERILRSLDKTTARALKSAAPVKTHLLITHYSPSRMADGQMLSIADIQDILKIELIGGVPESEEILVASNQGKPAIHLKDTAVAGAYMDVIDRFLGSNVPLQFIETPRNGFLKRFQGSR